MKLRGEASEGGVGIFYETKPTSLLESTKVLRKRFKKPPIKEEQNPQMRGYSIAFRAVWQV